MHHHDSEPCWSPHCAPHQTHPEAAVRELIAEAEARGAERVAQAVERLMNWSVGRPTDGIDRMVPASDLARILTEHRDERPACTCGAIEHGAMAQHLRPCPFVPEPPSDEQMDLVI